MQVKKVYDTTAEDLFRILFNAFKADYQKNTQKSIVDQDIRPGLSFKKYFGKDKENSALVKVEAMNFPHHYKVVLNTNRGSNIIEYIIEPYNDHEIEVTYREEYIDSGFISKLNNKLLYPFFRKSMTQRMESQVDHLVRHSKVRKDSL